MATDLRVTLGQAVRSLRSTARYSQEGFADAIGVHRTYMGTLERGDGNPTLETLELIAEGLGLKVSALILAAETGEMPAVTRFNTDRRKGSRGQADARRPVERPNPDR